MGTSLGSSLFFGGGHHELIDQLATEGQCPTKPGMADKGVGVNVVRFLLLVVWLRV